VTSSTATTPWLLEVSGLRKSFGAQQVLADVTTRIKPGEVRAFIGPNGAGKTTFINVLTGVYRASGGSVMLGGELISGLSRSHIARAGLARTYQIASLYPSMSVIENVVAACCAAKKFSRDPELSRSTFEDARHSLELVGLIDLAHRPVEEISHGDQRLLELALAISLRPRLLLMDEPTAGMSPGETAKFVKLVNDTLRHRYSIMLVEHDMQVVMGTADTISVLANGRVLAEGSPAEIRSDMKVQEAYLGSAYAH
jgi:branched-chain amino acid transport system ATP-binding protein